MKTANSIMAAAIVLLASATAQAQKVDFPDLAGPYLGQKPPGTTPELFAPGIVSRPEYFEHSAAVFTPDGKEVYWAAKANNQRKYYIYTMKMEGGKWSQPKLASFCREGGSYQQFVLSPDGQRLYFLLVGVGWLFVEKQNGAWGIPKEISPKIVSGYNADISSVSGNGSIYLIRLPEYDVCIARPAGGDYGTPEKLGRQINSSETREMAVFVAPDESYLIVEAKFELFISFRAKDGSWSERSKLQDGRFPHVSPDGKYLFFMGRDGIYWVSTRIIDELRPK